MKPFISFILFCLVLLASCNSSTNERKSETQSIQVIEKSPFNKIDSIQLSSGELYRISEFKSEYVSARNIDVWLPENYSKKKKYQVLLMHDGQMLFDSTKTWNGQEWGIDEKLSNLIKRDSVDPTIVVATWNVFKDRHSDYFPQKPFDDLEKNKKESLISYNQRNSDRLFKKLPQSDNYLKFLTQEVIPKIEQHFSVKDESQSYTVAGSSMGGLISFYALCEYPDIFGSAICMSTHWPGAIPYEGNPFPEAFFNYLDQKLPKLKQHKFYFDFGTKTLDELYPPFEDDVRRLFEKHGFNDKHFKQIKFIGDAHDEDSWRRRLHVPLKFALN